MKFTAVGYVLLAALLGSAVSDEVFGEGFHNLRFNDDLSVYTESDAWEAVLKNRGEDPVLSMGGQVRLRWELWENFGFADANDDDFGLLRTRLYANLAFGDTLRVFVEGKSALATDRDLPGGKRTLDEDTLALQNAFIDIAVPYFEGHDLVFRGGRQELQLGKQRLVSPLDWANTRRTWEGLQLISNCDKWDVSAFATRFVPVDRRDGNEGDDDERFHGIYATRKLVKYGAIQDLYWLMRDRRDIPGASEGSRIDEERHTVGTRLQGTCPLTGLDMDLEGAYQFGDSGDRDIQAWMAAVSAATPKGMLPGSLQAAVGFDIASGDSSADDDKAETFSQLYPLGHAYLGWIDVVGRQNIMDFSQEVSFKPIDKTLVKIQNHFFQRTRSEDALYNAGGGVVRAGDAGSEHDVGQELDFLVKYTASDNLAVLLGYSHFFAGGFIEQTANNEDIDFGYVSTQFTF